jgi:hypothetical protein
LEQPLKKEKWNKLIKEWIKKITLTIPLYHGLRYLNYQDFWPGKIHPMLKIKSNSTRELTRIPGLIISYHIINIYKYIDMYFTIK